MKQANERGVALILTLFLVAVLSVMAVSLAFLSQSETWSSFNYRLMVQARDGAEAGVNKAAHFLVHSYTPPPAGGDSLSNYTLTSSPVKYNNSDVVLASNGSSVSSNYPVSAVRGSFSTSGTGVLTAENARVRYTTYATLLSMRQVPQYGTTTPATIQSWRITAEGIVTGVQNSLVQITAKLERPIRPTFNYAAFATSCNDGALDFSGSGGTMSYDSSTLAQTQTAPQGQAYSGNVGTNGSLVATGNPVTINGTLSTPRTGVSGGGECGDGAQATMIGGASTQGITELPQQIIYPPPACWTAGGGCAYALPPLTVQTINGTCSGLAGCTQIGAPGLKRVRLAPGPYGNLTISGGTELHLDAGTYNINSFTLTSGTIVIDSEPVIFNIAGCATTGAGVCATTISPQAVLDLTGGSSTNTHGPGNLGYVPAKFQVNYSGTGNLKLNGSASVAAIVYAPNANITLNGLGNASARFYGSIIGQQVTLVGGATIYYDRALQNAFYTVGNYMLTSYNWRKF
ncbi:MAG: pilus assembly PilX N-terminal domain-containing protein [Acidobacteria bacterium]|nr:pilus assembly PilX N-terminal domain-containing protein [Acidobacteriota bacterium]